MEEDRECYCICRSTENAGKFMIACDNCEDWFHGDCVQVTYQTQSKKNYVPKTHPGSR